MIATRSSDGKAVSIMSPEPGMLGLIWCICCADVPCVRCVLQVCLSQVCTSVFVFYWRLRVLVA
jgi:hypothetical protein